MAESKGCAKELRRVTRGGDGFDEFAGKRVFEHAGLRGHDGRLFYTGGEEVTQACEWGFR